MSADPKSRLLFALALDCRTAARKVRTAKSDAERKAAEEEYAKASAAALKFIRSMITGKAKGVDDTQLDMLCRYVLGSVLLATLPNGAVRVDPFAQDGKKETASMSDDVDVPSELMLRANRLIQMATSGDEPNF